MRTWQELVAFERSLDAGRVLSVYLDATTRDPAARTAWRRSLRGTITALREGLRDAPHGEREAFDACVAQLEQALGPEGEPLGFSGWMGFFPDRGASLVEPLPAPPPALVAWEPALRIAPALAAIAPREPAFVAIVDARLARIWRCTGDQAVAVETLRAVAHVEPPSHMGAPPRAGFHTGTRGSAGTDDAQRELRAATEAMLRQAAARLEALSNGGGWILLGGIPVTAAELERLLPAALATRVRRVQALDVHATAAQIAAAAARESAALAQARAAARVREVVERDGARGRASAGLEATLEALRERAVEHLLLTPTFVNAHPVDAERMLREAHDQSARVSVVGGHAATELDEYAGGAGARLRFIPVRGQPAVTA